MYLNRNELSKQKGLFPFSHFFSTKLYTFMDYVYGEKKHEILLSFFFFFFFKKKTNKYSF